MHVILVLVGLACGSLIGYLLGFAARDQALRVLDHLHRQRVPNDLDNAQSVLEIATTLNMVPPNVRAALMSLERGGYVKSRPDVNMSRDDLFVRGGRKRSLWSVR